MLIDDVFEVMWLIRCLRLVVALERFEMFVRNVLLSLWYVIYEWERQRRRWVMLLLCWLYLWYDDVSLS